MAEYGVREKDVRKDTGSSSGGGSKVKHPFPDIPEPFLTLLIIAIVLGFVSSILALGPIRDTLYRIVLSALPFLIIASAVISGLLILGIIHSVVRLTKINRDLKASVHTEVPVHPAEVRNEKWDRVIDHIESDNPSDWRLAILEADIMLEEMMDKIGVLGDTLGEKLKNVEKSDFSTIDSAWEAHKVRNSIAHQGGAFSITEREARRVIRLYQSVFEEFKYI
jgi:hypothetical protein